MELPMHHPEPRESIAEIQATRQMCRACRGRAYPLSRECAFLTIDASDRNSSGETPLRATLPSPIVHALSMKTAHFLSERCRVMAVWEGLRSHFGSNRRYPVTSHSTCANFKKAHSLLLSKQALSPSLAGIAR